MTTRRGFLGAILAAGFAPAAVGSGVLMPVRKIAVPEMSGMSLLFEAQRTSDSPYYGWSRQERQRVLNAYYRALLDGTHINPPWVNGVGPLQACDAWRLS